MKNFSKNIFVWIIISLILLGLFNVFKNSQRDYSSVTYTYSTLLDKAQNGEIKSVEIQGIWYAPTSEYICIMVPNAPSYWCLDIFYASNAIR